MYKWSCHEQHCTIFFSCWEPLAKMLLYNLPVVRCSHFSSCRWICRCFSTLIPTTRKTHCWRTWTTWLSRTLSLRQKRASNCQCQPSDDAHGYPLDVLRKLAGHPKHVAVFLQHLETAPTEVRCARPSWITDECSCCHLWTPDKIFVGCQGTSTNHFATSLSSNLGCSEC